MAKYRIALAIDLLLFWFRSGGTMAVLLLIIGLIFRSATGGEGLLGWVGWGLLATSAALAIWALARCWRLYQVWKGGVRGTAVVVEIQRRVLGSSASNRTVRKRLRFRYPVGDEERIGYSSWGAGGFLGTADTGARIEVRYLPDRPGWVFWEEEVPVDFPPLYDRG